MMKQIIVGLAPAVFLVFVACGGSDKKEAPPTTQNGQKEHPDDKASREVLERQMDQMQAACSAAIGPVMFEAAKVVATNPGIPNQAVFQAPPVQQAKAQTQGAKNDCKKAVDNFMLNCKTMLNGTYCQRPDVQAWIAGNIQSVGSDMASQLPPQLQANPQYMMAMQSAMNYYMTTEGAQMVQDPMVRQRMLQYTGGV